MKGRRKQGPAPASPASPAGEAGPEPAGGARLRLAPGKEFDLIRRFLPHAWQERRDVQVGPGDDCAVVSGKGIVLSTDLSVEDVHFRRDWLSPRQIGERAAAAALSDLAAMAARPIGLLASVALPPDDAGDFAVDLMAGVREAVERTGGVLLGGDITRSPGPLVLDVTVVGESSEPVLRSGAKPGDEVWVTGDLGAAALCVSHLLRGETPPARAMERFAAPVPRTREARWLQQRAALTAMLDISDGLAGDAAHLATASEVAVVLERESIPVHDTVRSAEASEESAVRLAMTGGEDYELCLCAGAGSLEPVREEFEGQFGVRLSRVGTIEAGAGVFWRDPGGGRSPVEGSGFQHFGGSP